MTLKQFLVDVIMQLPKPKYQRKKLETCKLEVVEHTVISQKNFMGNKIITFLRLS